MGDDFVVRARSRPEGSPVSGVHGRQRELEEQRHDADQRLRPPPPTKPILHRSGAYQTTARRGKGLSVARSGDSLAAVAAQGRDSTAIRDPLRTAPASITRQ